MRQIASTDFNGVSIDEIAAVLRADARVNGAPVIWRMPQDWHDGAGDLLMIVDGNEYRVLEIMPGFARMPEDTSRSVERDLARDLLEHGETFESVIGAGSLQTLERLTLH